MDNSIIEAYITPYPPAPPDSGRLQHTPYKTCPVCRKELFLEVLESPFGFYVGTKGCCGGSPLSASDIFFSDRQAAEQRLREIQFFELDIFAWASSPQPVKRKSNFLFRLSRLFSR